MAKYVIKESELREAIREAVAEELEAALNEGLLPALGNTLKYGLLGVAAPALLAQKIAKKGDAIINGNDTITGTISDYFGGSGGSRSSSGGKQTKAERQNSRFAATKSISYEYGRPETVPGFGRRTKLEKKSEIFPPARDEDKGTGCTVNWGSFGKHYHDEGDRAWNRKITDIENAYLRNVNNNPRRGQRLFNRYRRILSDWLEDRDRAYEIYIKGQN